MLLKKDPLNDGPDAMRTREVDLPLIPTPNVLGGGGWGGGWTRNV